MLLPKTWSVPNRSLRSDPDALDHLVPLLPFCAQEAAELFGRAADRFDVEGCEPDPQLGRAERCDKRAVKLRDRSLGCSRRHDHRVPGGALEIGETCLGAGG